MRLPRVTAAAVGALLLVTLAGCGGSDPSSADDGPSSPTATETVTETPTPTATSTSSASSSASPTASSSAAAGPAECRTADVRFKVTAGGGAMGSDFSRIVMTNTSSSACVTGGYGGVSYVARGAVVGAPAARDRSVATSRIVLQPGQAATAQLQEAVAENYPESRCRPTTVTALRIYPPDETHPVEVRHTATGCAAKGVVLLHLQPYRGR